MSNQRRSSKDVKNTPSSTDFNSSLPDILKNMNDNIRAEVLKRIATCSQFSNLERDILTTESPVVAEIQQFFRTLTDASVYPKFHVERILSLQAVVMRHITETKSSQVAKLRNALISTINSQDFPVPENLFGEVGKLEVLKPVEKPRRRSPRSKDVVQMQSSESDTESQFAQVDAKQREELQMIDTDATLQAEREKIQQRLTQLLYMKRYGARSANI